MILITIFLRRYPGKIPYNDEKKIPDNPIYIMNTDKINQNNNKK